MFKKRINVNQFILGLFFLIWATNAYVLLGNLGKYLSLVLGMFFLVKSILVNKLDPNTVLTFIKIIIIFMMMVFIAKEQNQNTSNPITLVFGLLCVLLLLLGNVFGKTILIEKENNPKLVVLIAVLIFISNVKLYLIQSTLDLGTREIGDGTLNAVGVAYNQVQLFLLTFWMLIREKKRYLRIVLIGALISIVVSLVLTGSRGAMLFMVGTVLFFYRYLFHVLFKFKTIVIISIAIFSMLFFFRDSLFFNEKIDVFVERFSRASDFIEGNGGDRSLDDRADIQSVFYEKYDEMILGYAGYSRYPHNQFMEIYMRWGVFGIPLILFSIISFLKAYRFTKKKEITSLNYLIVSLFFFCFLQSMSSLSLEMNRLMWFGMGVLMTKSMKLKSIINSK